MTLHTHYHPAKTDAARSLFEALNCHAQTDGGRALLAQCNIAGFTARGSANFILDGGQGIFTRTIGDLDMRVLAADTTRSIQDIPALQDFIRKACEAANFDVEFPAAHVNRTRLAKAVRGYLYPELNVTLRTTAGQSLELSLELNGASPDIAPLEQPNFVKAENPYLRLAEKVGCLVSTRRVVKGADTDEQKQRRAIDLLDVYHNYHIALAHAGSKEELGRQLNAIFKGSRFSQFNRRQTINAVNQNLRRGLIHGDLERFDEAHHIEAYFPSLINGMKTKGMLTEHHAINPADVMTVGYDLCGQMRLPLSKTLMRVRNAAQPFNYSHIRKLLAELRPENMQDARQRALAIPLFLLLSPFIVATTAAVAITMRRKVIISQPRFGQHGKIFKIYKFRTMSEERGPNGELLDDDKRRTVVGSFLRATTMDELPQLWNVLRGDMVVIGPRPMEEQRPIPEWQALRQQVKPGLTGLVQIYDRPKVRLSDEMSRALETLYVHTAQRGGLKLWRLNAYILLHTAYVIGAAKHAEMKIPKWLERRRKPRGPSNTPP